MKKLFFWKHRRIRDIKVHKSGDIYLLSDDEIGECINEKGFYSHRGPLEINLHQKLLNN